MLSPLSIYLQNQILGGPIEVLFTLLIFILSKNLNATPFQLMVMASLKPITALFSYYASTFLHGKPSLIRPYLMINMAVGVIPCFLFPFVDNVWFYIASYAVYRISKRAEGPAWIELLKRNLNLAEMSKTISRGTSVAYFISMSLPPILAFWLDHEFWRFLFVLFAFVQLLNVAAIFSLNLSFESALNYPDAPIVSQKGLFQCVSDPVKQGIQLLFHNPSFAHYLFLFFLGGAGIILMQPTLPLYFNQYLNLSYQQLTLAFSFCKGISFLLSSPIWAKYMPHLSLYRLNAYMNILTALFIGGVLGASFGVEWLYAGYLSYGMMQGGCELSWNLSGPIFSKQSDSTAYSSLNLFLVGFRGCIFPLLGHLIFSFGGVIPVFLTALTICLIGVPYGLWLDAKYSTPREKRCISN